MIEGEFCGMEFHFSGVGAVAVKGVVENGKTQTFRVGRVDPELMGSAGNRLKMHSRDSILNGDTAPMGGAHFSMNLVINLVRAVVDIETEWQGDRTTFAEVLREISVEQGKVFLPGESVLKLLRKVSVSLLVEGQDE